MSNFNFLVGVSYTNYFNTNTPRGIELITALSLIGAILVGFLLVYFIKKDATKLYLKIAGSVFLAFALAIAIANIVMDFQEGETYLEKYQTIIISVLAAIILAVVFLVFMIDKKSHSTEKENTKSLVYAAISIALAFGLSYIRIFKAPYGGSITLASLLPIALYSYMFGVRRGLICGFIYGILQSVQDPWIVHPIQYLMDYPFAFGLIGLCGGMFRNKLKAIPALSLGLLIGSVGRFLCHTVSGVIFFEEYAAAYGFSNVWVYSMAYNALFVFPDIAIAIIAGCGILASKTIKHQLELVMPKAKIVMKPCTENAVEQNNNTVQTANEDTNSFSDK